MNLSHRCGEDVGCDGEGGEVEGGGGVLWEVLKRMEGATEKVGKNKGKTKGSTTKV